MDDSSLQKKTIFGLFWVFMERIGAHLVSFIVSVILARLLLPEDYGIIALVTVFTSILNVFVSNSFSQALVQKKDADDVDFSSVFYFNIVFSLVLYAGLFLLAPFIASFYEHDVLIPVIRVMGLQVLIAAVKSVQNAYVSRTMQFKKFFWSTIGGTLFSAVVGIIMAYHGFGIWALVAQNLTNFVIDTLVLSVTIGWRPKLKFSFSRLKVLISFGWKVLVSSLIDTVYEDIRSLVIGKKYTKADLAYYNRGKQFPNLIVSNINHSISGVLFPALSSKQDERERVKAITRRSITVSAYIMMPLLFGMAVVARPMVLLLLTEKWLPCVPFLQILCFNAALMPIQTANGQAILAVGRSDLSLKLNVAKKLFGLSMVIISSQISVLAMAFAGVFTGVFSSIVNAYPNKKLLNYGFLEQIKDIAPYVGLSSIMAGAVYWVIYLPIPVIFQLLIQIVGGAGVYIVLSALFKIDSYQYILTTIKILLKNHKK